MTDAESSAWAAGILEGEGYFGVSPRLRIECQMTDQDVVEKLCSVFGMGKVAAATARKEGHKPIWRWSVYSKTDILRVLQRVEPYMGDRRGARVAEMLQKLKGE